MHDMTLGFTVVSCLLFRKVPQTLAELKKLGLRQEGCVAQVIRDHPFKFGFINIPSLQEQPPRGRKVFFHEKASGISEKDSGKIKEGTKVQFSIDFDPVKSRYIAKKMFIQVGFSVSSKGL